MIRQFETGDLKALVEMVTEEYPTERLAIEHLLKSENLWVYEDQILKGFAVVSHIKQEQKSAWLTFYTKVSERRKGIGSALLTHGLNELQSRGIDQIITKYALTRETNEYFYSKRGFKTWFDTHNMSYSGTYNHTTELTVSPYSDEWFETYVDCLNACFYDLREANDVTPFDCMSKDDVTRKDMLSIKDHVCIFQHEGKFVGSVYLNEGLIDDVIVPIHLQGKGYGKKIVQYAMNEALKNGIKTVRLDVLDWNKRAFQMYQALGFKTTQTLRYARK